MDTEPRQGHDLSPAQAQTTSVTGWLHVSVHDWEIRLELVVQGDVPALEDVLRALDGHAAKVTLVSVY
jgi:hypothetical protein